MILRKKRWVILSWPFPTQALSGTLFHDYIEAYRGRNETCDAFHFAELLTIASFVAGRRVALDLGQKLYPNFYSVLVGEPGISRKTTSVRRAMYSAYEEPGLYMDTDIASAEGFKQAWIESSDDPDGSHVGFLALSEMQRLLIRNARKVTSNILPILTDLYDNPDILDHKLSGKKDFYIGEPTLTLIGGITPGLLDKHFTHDDFSSGFMSRLNFYVHQETKRVPHPEEPCQEKMKSVSTWLEGVSGARRVWTFDAETEKAYCDWYKSLDHSKEQNELLQQQSVRLEIQVPKLATLLCWMRGGRNVNRDDWKAALCVGEYWMATSRHLFAEFAANQSIRDSNLVIDFLRAQPGGIATQSEVNRALKRKLSSKELVVIFESLLATEKVVMDREETTGRPKTVWTLVDDDQ